MYRDLPTGDETQILLSRRGDTVTVTYLSIAVLITSPSVFQIKTRQV